MPCLPVVVTLLPPVRRWYADCAAVPAAAAIAADADREALRSR